MAEPERILVVLGAALLLAGITEPASKAQVDPGRAEKYFREAEALCEREAGRLWGASLCGPMVFADAVTGSIATNRPAPEAPRPRALGYANAAMEWGGERWSTFVWGMIPADDEAARARLMLHELFHRVQPELGLFLPSAAADNDHLDTPAGRYWMQLEWRALARALAASGEARESTVRDALTFRAKRRAVFPGAAAAERWSETNEGLAQYTATVAAASSTGEALASAIEQLEAMVEKESFVRTFAYPTGTAYGLLLDAYTAGWTRAFEAGGDLAERVRAAAGIETLGDAEALAARYGGAELWAEEETREAERQARIAALRSRFVEGPVLVVPRGKGASFITTGVTPIPTAGTVYPSYRVTGPWGSLEAEQVIVSPDGTELRVPGSFTTEGTTLTGEGWTVTLAPGWGVAPGPREGDFRVVWQEP